MNRVPRAVRAILGAFLVPSLAAGAPGSRLVIVGGGDIPKEATARLVAWAGGPKARLLVVAWASSEPQASCDTLLEALRAHGPAQAVCAPFTRLDEKGRANRLEPDARARFLEELRAASGVFFSGGDQARIMDVLADAELLRAVRDKHAQGAVFGGTSAGAAVMSARMITGEGDFTVIDGGRVDVREGLGLVQGAIVDQHFVKRQRENRLFGLVLKHPGERGVGIDEDTALLVSGRRAEVVGAGPVVLVDAVGPDRLLIRLVRPGQALDLDEPPRR
jgi:cyanophycinase